MDISFYSYYIYIYINKSLAYRSNQIDTIDYTYIWLESECNLTENIKWLWGEKINTDQ